jgi:hypothetical protein
MNSKRSVWKLLVSVACVGLFVTNCTIKTDDDDSSGCTPGKKKDCSACDNGVTGSQTCQDDGSYGACVCPGSVNGGASSGGASSGGSSSGGKSATAGYAGTWTGGGASVAGEGGEGGTGPVVYADCLDCLADRCAKEYAACDADPKCISADLDGTGQYERIAACIDTERVKGVVKRDVVRGCGVTIGASPDPDVISAWAPENMAATTTNLLNCMADAPGADPASWANDDRNYPVDGNDMINPTPWANGTCAKDACASAQ